MTSIPGCFTLEVLRLVPSILISPSANHVSAYRTEHISNLQTFHYDAILKSNLLPFPWPCCSFPWPAHDLPKDTRYLIQRHKNFISDKKKETRNKETRIKSCFLHLETLTDEEFVHIRDEMNSYRLEISNRRENKFCSNEVSFCWLHFQTAQYFNGHVWVFPFG